MERFSYGDGDDGGDGGKAGSDYDYEIYFT